MNNQSIEWVDIKTHPAENGWYMVRYKNEERLAMYFRKEKRSYSDSQWFVDSNTGYSWQGALPNQWMKIKNEAR